MGRAGSGMDGGGWEDGWHGKVVKKVFALLKVLFVCFFCSSSSSSSISSSSEVRG